MIYTELFPEPQQTTKLVIEQQIDEISLSQIGQGIGNVLGGVGTTVGAIGGVPQGIGRAIKKGYRSSVKGIGGEADPEPAATGTQATTAVSQPTATVQPKAEMPIGSGTINPRTGRPYVPSDFPTSADDQPDTAAQSTTAAQSSNRDAAAIQADIRNLDSSYKMRRNTLNRELEAAQSQPEPTAAQPEPTAAQPEPAALAQPEPTVPTSVSVGGQKIPPSDPLYAKVAAALQNQPLLQSIQALDQQKLATVKQILQRKVRGKLEEKALGAVLRTAGRALKATPGYLARGAGAVSGVVGGMKQAYSKAKQASTKFIGQGALSWDDVQIELANLSAEDAKALLSFVNQLTVSASKAKRKVKSKPVAKAKPTPAVTTPAFTGRSPTAATVHESLTWSKNFDPSRHLMSQIIRP